ERCGKRCRHPTGASKESVPGISSYGSGLSKGKGTLRIVGNTHSYGLFRQARKRPGKGDGHVYCPMDYLFEGKKRSQINVPVPFSKSPFPGRAYGGGGSPGAAWTAAVADRGRGGSLGFDGWEEKRWLSDRATPVISW